MAEDDSMVVAVQWAALGADGGVADGHRRGNAAVVGDADGEPSRTDLDGVAFDGGTNDADESAAADAFGAVDGIAGVAGGADDGIGSVGNGATAVGCDAYGVADGVVDVAYDVAVGASFPVVVGPFPPFDAGCALEVALSSYAFPCPPSTHRLQVE